MPGISKGTESIAEWFEVAPTNDPDSVTLLLPSLADLAKAALNERDRDSIEAAQVSWGRWWARIQRSNGGQVPDAWAPVLRAADRIVTSALNETAPIAAMHTLDEIAVDVLFVLRDSPVDELTTDEILNRVLFGDSDQVDYRGYLDRLAAQALLGVRWRPDRQVWRLSPLGRRTLVAIHEEVGRFIQRIRIGLLDSPEWAAAVARTKAYSATNGTNYELPEFVRAAIPGWFVAENPGASDGWINASIPEDSLIAARYYTCRFVSDSVGRCRHGASQAQRDSVESITYEALPPRWGEPSPAIS